MSNKTIQVLCGEPYNYSELALKEVANFAELVTINLTQDEFAEKALDYHVLMVRLKHKVTKDIIFKSEKLIAIISPTTGLDHIDLTAANQRDVKVFSLRGEVDFLRNIHSSAEHTFALILSLIRNIPQAFEDVKKRRWEQFPFRGYELNGKKFGILGFGRIGSKIAEYANAFGMEVLTYDPYVSKFPCYVYKCNSLQALLKESQIFSINIPLNKSTVGLIGLKELGLLPKDSFLINTSRGDILDEIALIEFLKSGHIKGAAIDVLKNENLITIKEHQLVEYSLTNSNLIITPHIGGAAWEAIEKTDIFIIKKFKKWLKKNEN
jgi:D-3-phosphoglycerate dehydrogenase / 2-oxoglutarate reductase